MEATYKALTKVIKSHSNVLIMLHKNIDLDAFGSALACFHIVTSMKKNCSILINKKDLNLSMKKAIKMVDDNFISKKDAKEGNFDLLIILDTSKKEILEDSSLLDKINDVVLIDHHVVMNRNILDTKLSYINSSLSSVTEFMTGYLKFLNKKVSGEVATIMLAGIEIDTNFYRVKTSTSTFLSSASLLLMGASALEKHNLLKETKEDYLTRVGYLRDSYIYKNNGICVINSQVTKEDLSITAERMLLFENVDAAFAIGMVDENIAISARSLGNVDVYKVMCEFDGGGHMTEAAAQIKSSDIKEIEKKLIDILR